MPTTIVITVFGADRPGLVEAVSARVTACGGNWLESRMLHLGGHFAGIVRLEVDATRHDELLDALRGLDRDGLSIVVHAAGLPATPAASVPERAGPASAPATIEILGQDRPGIVRDISRALATRGANVEELTTEIVSAPMTGEPMFKARADVLLPAGTDTNALRRELEKIAADLMVDLAFRPRE